MPAAPNSEALSRLRFCLQALGEEWKATSPEDREQYKEHAAEMSAEAALRPPKPAKAPKVPELKGKAARAAAEDAAAEDAAAEAMYEAVMEMKAAQAASASAADGYDWCVAHLCAHALASRIP